MDDFEHALEKENERLRAEVERLRRERAQLLDAKSTDGLSSSEWMMRTTQAEAEVERLTRERDNSTKMVTIVAQAAVVAGDERDEWKARAEAAEADNAELLTVLQKTHACGKEVCAQCGQVELVLRETHPGAALLERLRAAEVSARAWEEQYKQTERLRRSQGDRLDAAIAVVEAARISRREGLHGQLDAALAAYDAAKEGT